MNRWRWPSASTRLSLMRGAWTSSVPAPQVTFRACARPLRTTSRRPVAIGFPRTRGDGPRIAKSDKDASEFPPHARGWTQWQEQRSGSRRCHTRTVQKLDRGVDGRSCITLLTDSSSSTSHRAAGGTGRDHGASTGTRHVECLILCGSVTKAPSARQRSLPLKTVSTVFDCVSGSMGGKSAPQTLIGCHQRKALASR